MAHFGDRLTAAIREKRSCVVVGLDPRVSRLPRPLRDRATRSREDAARAVVEFNRGVLEAVAPYAVAVKPQAAFYEELGWQGFKALEETVAAARRMGLLVIADMKRGDIGSTAAAYARACLDTLDADAVTVNGYFGSDGVAPFLEHVARGKGVFVLVKTSNPSSVEVQDVRAGEQFVYERMADLVTQWSAGHIGREGYSAVGAVVGATFPAVIARLRAAMPHAILLLPGYGAQGATAGDCAGAFDANGLGAVVNSSRGIIFAYEDAPAADWRTAVGNAARRMRDDLETARSQARPDASQSGTG